MGNDWIIVYGSLGEGIKGIVGPFDSEGLAEDYSESHNLGHFEKCICKVDLP